MNRLKRHWLPIAVLVVMLLLPACGGQADVSALGTMAQEAQPAAQPEAAEKVTFTLESSLDGGMHYRGVGGEIDGVVNPTLTVPAGAEVEIVFVNGDGTLHDLSIEGLALATSQFSEQGATESLRFTAAAGGSYAYFCTVPGHRQAGMEGKIVVEGEAASTESAPAPLLIAEGPQIDPVIAGAPMVAADPNVVPAPLTSAAGTTHRVDLVAIELDGRLADGTSTRFWTFDGTVPGPMLRVQVGDTVELSLTNEAGSEFPHSIDLHAVTGYLGGGEISQTAPGERTAFTFRALNPGVYVYHCATPMVPHHIAMGMYGLIVVEPEGGLPPVDREFYVMQGEVYAEGAVGEKGHLDFDLDAMLAEDPSFVVFNGSTEALMGDMALRANVGETVRIYMGVGGPNLTSSFHVIGEIFDRAYPFAAITSPPLTDVQTVSVPPGGATVVEMTLEQPGTYLLVDHALGRAVKGLMGALIVEGEADPAVSAPLE